jgi:hypothetical protein
MGITKVIDKITSKMARLGHAKYSKIDYDAQGIRRGYVSPTGEEELQEQLTNEEEKPGSYPEVESESIPEYDPDNPDANTDPGPMLTGSDIQETCVRCGKLVVGIPIWVPEYRAIRSSPKSYRIIRKARRPRKKQPLCSKCKKEIAKEKAADRQRKHRKERPIGVLWIPEMGTLEAVRVS